MQLQNATPVLDGSVIVNGRYMLPDQTEHACRVSGLSPVGATFESGNIPAPGTSIVAYLDEVGRVEATVGASQPNGFEIAFAITGPRLERLQARIKAQKERRESGAPESRVAPRYEPKEKSSQIVLGDGRAYDCEVIDISISGAAVKTSVIPGLGTQLSLGKMKGRVVRYIENGIAIQFNNPLEQSQMSSLVGRG